MTYETITLTIENQIATITLNRPERLNACSPHGADEISHALINLEDARVLVLRGEGRAFCSGADLAARGERSIGGGEGAYVSLTQHYNPMIMRLMRLNMPIITAVQGPAAGVGCSLALTGDFVIAGRSGYFLQAFANIGLVPDGGSTWLLPHLIGKARATQMMLLGEKIGGEQAAEWGLIYKCVEDDALAGEVEALAARLAVGPTLAYSVMRRNILTALESGLADTMQAEAEGQRIAGNSQDAVEGGMAFLQKRKAEFKGS
jgi:2-(1,2-epoxy-1,2-dihydrophenyl)acetyl-CoA isomerase